MYSVHVEKVKRQFLPQEFTVTEWSILEPYFKNLADRSISSLQELKHWLKDQSELEAAIDEEAAWRYIRMTCDTENKDVEESYNYFHQHILPQIQPYTDLLNKKLIATPYSNELDETYAVYLRNARKDIELFREQNIPLQAELSVLQQQHDQIVGAMTVTVNGEDYTIPQASKFLDSPDRALREEVYKKIQERRYADKEKLDELFTALVSIRQQVAVNAGFETFRDYRFKELGRFDYTKEDCFKFHEAVKQHVLPLVRDIYLHKKQKLGLETLRPWDLEAEPEGIEPLVPFTDGNDLLEKSIVCMQKVSPFFGQCLETMKSMGRLDLESRKGKGPGGYNQPLLESGVPFIFMNAAGQMHDVTTMVHEGGHAVQAFLAHNLELSRFKDYPMEIAEVASMSMELFTMQYWDAFFSDPDSLTRAQLHQLERVITLFPWIAIIDAFQHWIYEHPTHTIQERTAQWMVILAEFHEGVVEYEGLEEYRAIAWQRQLHLFIVPFYYIEYGIAQLGAIGLWMQYKQDPDTAIERYCNTLALGSTKTLPQLYNTAGLEFDFSPERIKVLMDFVTAEMKKLIK